VGEQPVVRRLPQREEEPDLVVVHRQARAELGHPGRQQRRGALGTEREPDVGGADDLAGERAHGGAGLAADQHPADPAEHPAQAAQATADRLERLAEFLRQPGTEFRGILGEDAAHGVHGLVGDRVTQC
jgi:hypothetical protein